MPLVEINWQPTVKQLCSFGKVALIASVVLTILLYVIKGIAIKWCAIIVFAGCLIFLCSLISIKLTKVIYLALTLLTVPIGTVVSFILLAACYYLLFMPVGLFFRLMGRDLLKRKFDSTTSSYWIERHPPDNLERYFHQF
jgi:hypothetical protein